jgi:hypothetical protein
VIDTVVPVAAITPGRREILLAGTAEFYDSSLRLTRVLRRAAVMVVLALVAAGCGGSDRIARTTGVIPVVQKSGVLASTPSPLTLHDISQHPNGSPQRMLTTFWFLVQWGAAPEAVSYYSQNVRRAIGSDTIELALQNERSALQDAEIKVVGSIRNSSGDTVSINLLTTGGPPQHESYLVRKIDGNWKIAYDTLLLGLLPGTVALQRERQIGHTPNTAPSASALAAGQRVADKFTQLATPALPGEHSPP